MDRVRGAIFDSLGDFIVDARVLDLFAGSGSLGIEALSRGAASAVFVEGDRKAIPIIEKNLETTRLQGGTVHSSDVFSYLDRLAQPGSFELIMADPPYAKAEGDREFSKELMNSAALQAALAPGGIFVLEHLPQVSLDLGQRWEYIREKRYGATTVSFLRVLA